MTRFSLLLVAIAAALALLVSVPAAAQVHGSDLAPPTAAEPGHGAAQGHGEAAAHGEGAAEGEAAGHGEHAPQEFNWFYGLLYESEGAEPSVLVRPKGMQPPFLALLLNTLGLVWVVWRYGRRPVSDALKKRRATIMQGIDDAARMRDDAEERLAEYEDKLEHLDDEIERLKREMREAGEAERARILAEAKERRTRMERDAHLLIEQELKAAREDLVRDAVAAAMKSAAERLAKSLSAADHQRIADEYLTAIDRAQVNAKGGQA
jgi:F-type H+-transporting ATPase subunit b